MIVIAYYTTGTTYVKEAQLLEASLERVGMEYQILEVPDQGSWDANVRQKANFIRDQRHFLRGPLLYIDVDAFVHKNCSAYFDKLGEQGVDFAAHWFAGPGKGTNFARDNCACLKGKPCDRPHRLLSGTLFFGDTNGARQLIDIWIGLNEACRKSGWSSGGGQRNLWAIVTAQARYLKTVDLPGRFTYVFDKAQGYPKGEPRIIEHTIGSRDNRGKKKLKTPARHARIGEMWSLVERGKK